MPGLPIADGHDLAMSIRHRLTDLAWHAMRRRISTYSRPGSPVVLRLAFTLVACVAAWATGCQTPAVYESPSLPRFLIDNLPAEASIAPAQDVEVVPVTEPAVVTLPDAVRECVLNN